MHVVQIYALEFIQILQCAQILALTKRKIEHVVALVHIVLKLFMKSIVGYFFLILYSQNTLFSCMFKKMKIIHIQIILMEIILDCFIAIKQN